MKNMPRAGTLPVSSPEDDAKENFQEKMRSFRQKNGLSQRELGDAIGYSQKWISDLERGKENPSKQFVKAFEEFVRKIR